MWCVSRSHQPDDRGTVGGHAVLRVLRRGPQAVHSTSQPLEEGSEVHEKRLKCGRMGSSKCR